MDALERLKTALPHVPAGQRDIFKYAIDEIERLRKIETAARFLRNSLSDVDFHKTTAMDDHVAHVRHKYSQHLAEPFRQVSEALKS